MSSPFDRWSQGPSEMQPGDEQGWYQMARSLPPEQFAQVAGQAFQQVHPQDYYEHSQPGIGGTDPFGSLPQEHQSGLAQTLLGSLFNRGVNQDQVQQGTGISNLDPSQMSPQELAALAQWMHQNHPQALGEAAAQYQGQPDILSRLMGNKALLALAATVGAGLLAKRA
jgi:hypothetical protein